LVATGDRAGRVWIWRAREAAEPRELPGSGLEITNLAFFPDGSRCLVFTRDGEMSVWRLDSFTQEFRTLVNSQGASESVFSADNSRLITAGNDGMVLVWSVPDFRLLATLTTGPDPAIRGPIASLALAPDGNTLIALSENGTLRRWNLRR
jgi:WD40 repeat protein